MCARVCVTSAWQEGTQARRASRLAQLAEAEARAVAAAGDKADVAGAQQMRAAADKEMGEAKEALRRAEKEVLEAVRAVMR